MCVLIIKYSPEKLALSPQCHLAGIIGAAAAKKNRSKIVRSRPRARERVFHHAPDNYIEQYRTSLASDKHETSAHCYALCIGKGRTSENWKSPQASWATRLFIYLNSHGFVEMHLILCNCSGLAL